ncbi:MAG: hypothetical protein LBL72_07305 [Candidatus Accumulibacter sp.]|jgi:hypothetical protein|nr:hypothetical protein [Accumulibacter sp.]
MNSFLLQGLGLIALVTASFVGGCRHGEATITAKWHTERIETENKFQQLTAKQAQASAQVVTEYVQRAQEVKERGKNIVKEVKVYVPSKADAACTVPRGFIRLHDAAAQGVLPGAPGLADAAPSGLAFSAATATVADNYGRCHEVAEQLKALQGWVREQQTLFEGSMQ